MAVTSRPAPKPPIIEIFDNTDPRLHWWDRPGGGWTPESALARTLSESTIHWTEEHTQAGQPLAYYQQMIAKEAAYHAFQRDWEPDVPGVQGGNGFMYHYAITPPTNTGQVVIFQTTPETARTWNAFEANAHNLAVVILAGHGDPVYAATQAALRALLNWFTTGRPDLPLLTARPATVTLPNTTGGTTVYQTAGVLTHDESMARHNRPPKGCCGIYAATVKAWRAGAL